MTQETDVVVVHRSATKRKGFAQIPHAVLIDPELSDAAVRLYGVLLSYAMQADAFKVSQQKMATDARKDERTIRRLLSELHKRGLVTPERQGQRMVNIYVLEDAYALYDNERPAPSKRVRNEIRQDRNARSENGQSDRSKMSGHAGQKSPVMQDKNALLLNTPENKKENRKEILPSASEEKKEPGKPIPAARSAYVRAMREVAKANIGHCLPDGELGRRVEARMKEIEAEEARAETEGRGVLGTGQETI